MKRKHRDSELYKVLHFTPGVSSEIQNKMDAAYKQIANGQNTQKKKKRAGFYLKLAAAIILMLGFIGFGSPALAGKIPFIGRIFQMVEDKIGYPGNFSDYAVPLTLPEIENEKVPDTETTAYSQTVGDITVTLSEASYTDMALYFSLELYSEEGFPEDFNRVKNMEGYILSYDILNTQCSQSFDFTEEALPAPYAIEGNYVDSHTFLGVIRVDLETIRNILGVSSLPSEFTYSFTILRFWGRLKETKDVPLTDSDTGQTTIIQVAVKKYYEGPWNFTVPVSIDRTGTLTKEIMETNADGVGISTITKTRYEIGADIILPADAEPADYIVVITDADGKILDAQGDNAEIYSVYGRNTDTVHVYVVDYLTFMDECKAENAYLLPEKSLFWTTVDW